MSRIREVQLYDANGNPLVFNDGRVPVYMEDRKIETKLQDSPDIDAFARLRVSNPTTLFDNQLEYDLTPLLYSNKLNGAGTITHLPNQASAELSTGGTAAGDEAIMQTKQYFRYQPGKSQLVFMTAVLGAPKAAVRQRLGYFDAFNGVFFEQTEVAKKVVLRSSTSGAPVDTAIEQADWNLDTFDGSGPSGITIDFSKAQIFFIDFEWLGTGRIRYGFFINGLPHYCHEILNANNSTTVYMRTPNLPVRTEITNTGTAASATVLQKICTSVISEGGLERGRDYSFSADTGITPKSVSTTRIPILSLTPRALFNGLVNRATFKPEHYHVTSNSQRVRYQLVYNGILTGAAFTDVDTANSGMQVDTSATAISGGIVVDSGYVMAATGAGGAELAVSPINTLWPFTLDIDGNPDDIFTITAQAFASTTDVSAAIAWLEYR